MEEAGTAIRNNSHLELRDGVSISTFDLSVENFLATMEKILEFCDGTKEECFEASGIDQFKSSIVFLREWKQYYFCEWMPSHCKPKTINFACQNDFAEAGHVINGINLPHFSSAAIPKRKEKSTSESSLPEIDDFVLHVGGSVWALDWCPRFRENSASDVKCEYLAVAAHPSGSEYHKIGEPLSGRGVIQIWCFPHLVDKKELSTLNPGVVRPRGRPRKNVDEMSFVPIYSGGPNKSVQSNPMEVFLTSDIAVEDPPAPSTSNSLASVPKRQERPKKYATSITKDVILTSNAEFKDDLTVKSTLRGLNSFPKHRGRPKKSVLSSPKEVILASDTEYMEDPSVPSTSRSFVSVLKCRGRPRKCVVSNPEEAIIAIDPNHMEDLPTQSTLTSQSSVRKRRGRPRKFALSYPEEIIQANGCKHIEDASRLSTLTDLSSVKRCRRRPRKSVVSSPNEVTLASKVEDMGNANEATLGSKDEDRGSPTEVTLANDCKHMEGPSALPTVRDLASVQRRRGRPRKSVVSIPNKITLASKDEDMESPPKRPTIGCLATSEEHSVSNEFHKNDVPKGTFGGNLSYENNEAYPHGNNDVRSTGKRKGRPRKKPILSEKENDSVCLDHLPASFNFCTSRCIETSSGSLLSDGCRIEEPFKSITCLSDLNEQEKEFCSIGRPTHQECSHLSIDDLDVPLTCVLSPGSNGRVESVTFRRRQNESSDPSEEIILSRGFETLGKSSITEKAIVVTSQEGCSDGTYVMRTCLQGSKMEDNDKAITTFNLNEQALKTKNGDTEEMSNRFSGGKFSISKLDSALSPVKEDHELEAGVLTRHDEGCQEIAVVTKKLDQNKSSIPECFALPRLVLCLAHNGKVAWDMKWRPHETADSKDKHHMGYLAVLLGNGSLEVWEVPAHSMVQLLYASCQTVGADPRFLKLEPIFKCSRVKFADKQSIPLALEWSPSASRDLILAGCHDGTVAIWKFSAQSSSQDTRPLLCFTADNGPIRALAWAPDESDTECSNLIVTAGHEGLKFWDIRDPYRPLWDLCPVQRAVLGLDWLKDPRCIIIAYEDGVMRTISLERVANDVPVTGKILSKTKQQGVSSQFCSSFAIWSVQVSRSTGLVAYCGSDGCTRYFQLTTKAIDKGASRYREPHFLCGSLSQKGSTLMINTPLTSTPLPKKSFSARKVVKEAKQAISSVPALCWHDDQTIANSCNHKRRKANLSKGAKSGDIEIEEGDSSQSMLTFPPKTLAMHKVRWNMNKGSERWLCYGGAAGIVRCHKISK